MEETLRDKIAISVLPEILKATDQLGYYYKGCENFLADDCAFAYKIADEMLKQRLIVKEIEEDI